MKIIGLLILVVAVFNLIGAFAAIVNGSTEGGVSAKFINAAIDAAIGGLIYYIGYRRNKRVDDELS